MNNTEFFLKYFQTFNIINFVNKHEYLGEIYAFKKAAYIPCNIFMPKVFVRNLNESKTGSLPEMAE